MTERWFDRLKRGGSSGRPVTSTIDWIEPASQFEPLFGTAATIKKARFSAHTTTTLAGVWICWSRTVGERRDQRRVWDTGTQWSIFVTSLPDPQYEILTPFQMTITQVEADAFAAQLRDANLAMVGETAGEAYENLLANLLEVFDLYTREEASLGPEPTRQLAALRKYIAKRP